MRVRLPTPPPNIVDPEVLTYLRQLIQSLERAFDRLPEQPFTRDRIVLSNLTKQYTLDAAAGTLADTRSVLGTLLEDLQVSGKIS